VTTVLFVLFYLLSVVTVGRKFASDALRLVVEKGPLQTFAMKAYVFFLFPMSTLLGESRYLFLASSPGRHSQDTEAFHMGVSSLFWVLRIPWFLLVSIVGLILVLLIVFGGWLLPKSKA
jgi:hypothetical protein